VIRCAPSRVVPAEYVIIWHKDRSPPRSSPAQRRHHGLQHRGEVGRAGNSLDPILPAAASQRDGLCLAAKIEQALLTGSAANPVERTLLTTGVLEACLHSRYKLNQRLEALQLAVSYQVKRMRMVSGPQQFPFAYQFRIKAALPALEAYRCIDRNVLLRPVAGSRFVNPGLHQLYRLRIQIIPHRLQNLGFAHSAIGAHV
jgi:hypothetical protein